MDKDSAIRTLWDYLRRGEPPAKADIIFVLGNEDTRCAEHAAELWHFGYAPIVVMSGATGRSTRGVFRKSEAELFAGVAMAHGVPESALILEPHATNTGENVKFTRELLAGRGVFPKNILAVQKPYAERRVLVSLRHFRPGVGLRVTSPAWSFDEYCSDGVAREEVPAMLAGEVHRMLEYPKRGWQAEEPVPADAVAGRLHAAFDSGRGLGLSRVRGSGIYPCRRPPRAYRARQNALFT